jgi:endo-1,4-beta-xylanase
MFLPVWQQILHTARIRVCIHGFLVCALALLSAGSARAQIVALYTFADGTADGWTSFNGASTPVASNAEAYAPSGSSYSLLTTTNSSGQSSGPSTSLTNILLPGAQYTITGYLMLSAGEAATSANFTMQRTDSSCSGGTCYDTIGNYQVPVTASGWTQIGGSYTVSATETALTLYAQLVGPSSAQSFYLADVVITETSRLQVERRWRLTPLPTADWTAGSRSVRRL